MTTLRLWLPLLVALVFNAAANVLLKLGAQARPAVAADAPLMAKVAAFLNGTTIVALVVFALNVLFYLAALKQWKLSVAYPIMLSGTLILVVLAARVLPQLRESLTPVQIIGMAVIIAGVWMVASGMK